MAEDVLENDLRRLKRLIKMQIEQERRRTQKINEPLRVDGTELVATWRAVPLTIGRMAATETTTSRRPAPTKRGAKICYRLFDLGKSPIAVAYPMGMTLRSTERRQ